MPTIDYYLSAEDFEPERAQDHYTERLVALPHLGCCYAGARTHPLEPPLERYDLDPDVPLLICAGTPFKYAPQHDHVFPDIARRLGRCRFVFFTHPIRDLSQRLERRLAEAFARAGVDFAAHVAFLPWLAPPEFYGLMRRADVYLDTIGFSGFNTAMQALECGLPVVTREGRFMRGRLASGILRRMGMQELVASSSEQYVSLAARLIEDADYGEQVCTRIASARDALFDDPAPVRGLERFLESC